MQHSSGTNTRALTISSVLIFLYFFAEITVALVTGSLSLLADAAHELSTVVAIGISLLAMRLSKRAPDDRHSFGLLRSEAIAALVNGLLLVGMAAFIIARGVQRLADPVEMSPGPMFAMAIGGIGLEIASLAIMFKGQRDNLNIRASFWHVMNAFLGSIAVIIAAIFIAVADIYEADTWAGMIFALVLLWAAFGIIRDALQVLSDATPTDVDMVKVRTELLGIAGVTDVHHLHARTISGPVRTFSGHVVLDNLSNAPAVLDAAKQILEDEHGFSLTTLQLEPTDLHESNPSALEPDETHRSKGDGHPHDD